MKALTKGTGSINEVAGVPVVKSGTSTGTGADQVITHGHGTTWTYIDISIIPVEAGGVVFSGISFDDEDGRDHFHVTAEAGKAWAWTAMAW